MPTNGIFMYQGTVISLYRFIYLLGTDIRMLVAILEKSYNFDKTFNFIMI
jgi:hypothetical protein